MCQWRNMHTRAVPRGRSTHIQPTLCWLRHLFPDTEIVTHSTDRRRYLHATNSRKQKPRDKNLHADSDWEQLTFGLSASGRLGRGAMGWSGRREAGVPMLVYSVGRLWELIKHCYLNTIAPQFPGKIRSKCTVTFDNKHLLLRALTPKCHCFPLFLTL